MCYLGFLHWIYGVIDVQKEFHVPDVAFRLDTGCFFEEFPVFVDFGDCEEIFNVDLRFNFHFFSNILKFYNKIKMRLRT